MKLLNILNRLIDNVILAVVRVETIERGYEIADGCLEGGVEVLEISYLFLIIHYMKFAICS